MAKLDFTNKWVLITGASSGLGWEMAKYMAKHEKANLVIAARRLDRLEQLKNEILADHNAGATGADSDTKRDVKIIQADLANPQDVERLFTESTANIDLYAVINNAGVTYYGPAESRQLETFETILNVNLKALITLTLRFFDWFHDKGRGAILNVTSEAGLIPVPYQAVYSASKHAAQAFTEALIMENRKGPVIISSYAPGGIATEMLTKSGLAKKHPLESPFNMDAAKAAKLAIKTFKKKKFVSVPGLVNKLTVLMTRFLPRKLVTKISELVYRSDDVVRK